MDFMKFTPPTVTTTLFGQVLTPNLMLSSQCCHIKESIIFQGEKWPWSWPSLLKFSPNLCLNFFRSYELTRKDRLYQNIERLQHSKGTKHFNFVPKTFMIPTEYSEFAATHHRMRGAWIVKPVASSRGRGIFIVSHPNQVPLDEPMVKFFSLLKKNCYRILRFKHGLTKIWPLDLPSWYKTGLKKQPNYIYM